MIIDINNIINISVIAPASGLAPYSVNNLLCLTKDTPAVSLGSNAYAVYSNAMDVITQWGSSSGPGKAATAVFAQSPNIISGGGKFIVAPMVTDETIDLAITRLSALFYFGGLSYDFVADATEGMDAASVAQSVRKFLFVVSSTSSDFDGSDGLLYQIVNGHYSYTRGLYHTDSTKAQAYKWGYASRAMSTNFSGVNTTQSMQVKELNSVTVDDGMTSTLLTKAQTNGVDVYVNISGKATIMSYGANEFFDDVYNLKWCIGALEVEGFNRLRQTGTKLPQTEAGMNNIKDAYRGVCQQAVANRFVGPGSWTSSDTFGSPEDFRRNILETGYYIYSAPVSQQSSADRLARKAVPVMIALKFQGAIHSSDVIIFVNK